MFPKAKSGAWILSSWKDLHALILSVTPNDVSLDHPAIKKHTLGKHFIVFLRTGRIQIFVIYSYICTEIKCLNGNVVNYFGNEAVMNSGVGRWTGFSASNYQICSKFYQTLFFSSTSLKRSFSMDSRKEWSLAPLVKAAASLLIAPALKNMLNPTLMGCWCIHWQKWLLFFCHTP